MRRTLVTATLHVQAAMVHRTEDRMPVTVNSVWLMRIGLNTESVRVKAAGVRTWDVVVIPVNVTPNVIYV